MPFGSQHKGPLNGSISLSERSLDGIIVQTCAEQVMLTGMLKCSHLPKLSSGSLLNETTGPSCEILQQRPIPLSLKNTVLLDKMKGFLKPNIE